MHQTANLVLEMISQSATTEQRNKWFSNRSEPAYITITSAGDVINVCVVTLDMSVMFCACEADKGDLLKQKLAPAPLQWVFYGFVVNKNRPFISWGSLEEQWQIFTWIRWFIKWRHSVGEIPSSSYLLEINIVLTFNTAQLFDLQSTLHLLGAWRRGLRQNSAVLGMSSHARQDHTDHKRNPDKNSTG